MADLVTWRLPLLVVCEETKKSPQPMRAEALSSMGLAGEVAFEWFLPKIRQRNRTVMTAVLFIEASNILAQEVEYYD